MKVSRIAILLLLIANLAALPAPAKAQSTATPPDAPSASKAVAAASSNSKPEPAYVRPSHRTKARNYFFDAFGPYPILGAAITAGIDQDSNTPPEWKQGGEAYGKRFGSAFGMSAVSTTTRYILSEAFQEDMLYYPCECKGFFPRLGHSVISTFTARRGEDGHRVFSVPSIIAPYAGTMAGVYGWYPDRYGAKDAFRMGNYSVLGYVGTNVAKEFIFSGPHSLLSHMHRKNNNASSSDSKP